MHAGIHMAYHLPAGLPEGSILRTRLACNVRAHLKGQCRCALSNLDVPASQHMPSLNSPTEGRQMWAPHACISPSATAASPGSSSKMVGKSMMAAMGAMMRNRLMQFIFSLSFLSNIFCSQTFAFKASGVTMMLKTRVCNPLTTIWRIMTAEFVR